MVVGLRQFDDLCCLGDCLPGPGRTPTDYEVGLLLPHVLQVGFRVWKQGWHTWAKASAVDLSIASAKVCTGQYLPGHTSNAIMMFWPRISSEHAMANLYPATF